MTYEELKEIKLRLDKWREERHLSYESQQKGFMPNILEELREYYLAKDDDERVAELCDVLILCLNVKVLDNRLKRWMIPIRKGELCSFIRWILNDISCMVDCMGVLHKDEIFTSNVDSVIAHTINFISELGYKPYECLKEKVKEIESRTGHYDERLGKFVKDIGAYTKNEAEKLAKEQCLKKIGHATLALLSLEKDKDYFCFDFAWRENGKDKRYTEKIKKWHKAKMVRDES